MEPYGNGHYVIDYGIGGFQQSPGAGIQPQRQAHGVWSMTTAAATAVRVHGVGRPLGPPGPWALRWPYCRQKRVAPWFMAEHSSSASCCLNSVV